MGAVHREERSTGFLMSLLPFGGLLRTKLSSAFILAVCELSLMHACRQKRAFSKSPIYFVPSLLLSASPRVEVQKYFIKSKSSKLPCYILNPVIDGSFIDFKQFWFQPENSLSSMSCEILIKYV